jgi:hypothetical protein
MIHPVPCKLFGDSKVSALPLFIYLFPATFLPLNGGHQEYM